MVHFRSFALLGSTALGLVVSAPALAQSTSAQSEGARQVAQNQSTAQGMQNRASTRTLANTADTGQLQDIIVTAERTSSDVQRTPISIAVVGADEIASRGVNDLTKLTQVEPSVVFNVGQFSNASVTIRGVSSSGSTTFGGSAVSISTDGQYVFSGFNGILFDVNRVEILKGPQGTLYGLNSTAGAINIITNTPELNSFGFNASAEFGNYDTRRFEANVNVPLGDTAAIRLSGYTTRQDGYRKHPGMAASDFADVDAVRASILWEPIERLNLRLTGEYFRDDRGNSPLQGIVLSPSAENPAGSPPVNFDPGSVDPHHWPVAFEGHNKHHMKNVRLKASYDFDFATITYLGSLHSSTGSLFQPSFGTASPDISDYDRYRDKVTTWQHEVRLNGLTDFGLKWQAGYYRSNYRTDQGVYIFNGVTRLSPPLTVPFLRFAIPDNEATISAFYGQVTQKLTDKLSITGGVRTTKDKQVSRHAFTESLDVGAYFGSGGATQNYSRRSNDGSNKFKKTSWHAGLDYQATPSNLIYFSAGTGFKDGGFTQFNSFFPEEITAYEIGTKNRFFNGKVQLNAAMYTYDYTNQQVQVFQLNPVSNTSILTTLNAGASRLQGAEANLLWQISPDDQLSLSASYTHAEYTKFDVAQPIMPIGDVTTINRDLAGNRPPQAPRWTLTGGYNHTWHFGSNSLTAGVNTRYMTDYYLSPFNLPADKVKGFMQTDASITFTGGDGLWDVSAYVRNLENNDIRNQTQFLIGGATTPVYLFGWAPPRTYGVRLAVHYK